MSRAAASGSPNSIEVTMTTAKFNLQPAALVAAIGCGPAFLCSTASAEAQANEQFFPLLADLELAPPTST
jgi:hypothetical protein